MLKKNLLGAAVATVLGTAGVPQVASADIMTFDWDGVFTMLDGAGAALANTSIPAKGNNQFQTNVTGTITFDLDTGAGTGTLVPFDFFAGTLPAEAVGINMQAIGNGMGTGPGTLVLGNMLFNWNGTNGIPVSLIMDAAGMFGSIPALYAGGVGTTVSGVGATPASDGTYVGPTIPGTVTGPGGFAGYLGLGASPITTTAWNTTNAAGCTFGSCSGIAPSGELPMILDTVANANDFVANDGGTIGGNPMQDGPFQGSNANFDITKLTLTNLEITGGTEIPVPAAVWLFGSGLLGLVGVGRRRSKKA